MFSSLVGSLIGKITGVDSLGEEQRKQLDELNFIKRRSEEKLEYLRKLNSVTKSNQEIEGILKSIEIQEGIFSEQDKKSLLESFNKERVDLVNKSAEIKKSLDFDSLSKAFK